jgi:hypothetical protein
VVEMPAYFDARFPAAVPFTGPVFDPHHRVTASERAGFRASGQRRTRVANAPRHAPEGTPVLNRRMICVHLVGANSAGSERSRRDGSTEAVAPARVHFTPRVALSAFDTGLNFWDRALLENVQRHGPKAAYVIGHTLAGPGWDTDPIGDGWLLWRLRRMATLPVPLVRLLGELDTLRGTRVKFYLPVSNCWKA